MSKRYGRNQKRKARELIEHIREGNRLLGDRIQMQLADICKLEEELEAWDARIVSALGPFSLLKRKLAEQPKSKYPVYEMIPHYRDDTPMHAVAAVVPLASHMPPRERMHHFCLFIEDEYWKAERLIFFKEKRETGDRSVGFCISDMALAAEQSGWGLEWLATEIGRSLVSGLRNAAG